MTSSTSITVTETAQARIHKEREKTGKNDLFLRLMVEGGGCSGFQYVLTWENTADPSDHVADGLVHIDPISYDILSGSIVDFTESLMGSDFKIINPHAVSGCGCGTSFSLA